MKRTFPTSRHEHLDILAGTWKTTIGMLAPDGTPTGEEGHATDTYSWMANGFFLMHDVDAVMGGEKIRSLEIIGVDPETEGYISRSYDADGTTSDFTAELTDDQWRIAGRLQRFWGTFSDNYRTLTGRWQQRDDEMHEWQPLMSVTLRKEG